jgi:hypothetical protein
MRLRKWIRIREDSIKTDIREVRSEDGTWVELAQDRVRWRDMVSVMENLQDVPSYTHSFIFISTYSVWKNTIHSVRRTRCTLNIR